MTNVGLKARLHRTPTIDEVPLTASAAQLNAAGTYVGTLSATADEVNRHNDRAVGAITATADGLTTGLIAAGVTHVVVTSGAATNAVSLPGIAANALPPGYEVKGRVGANGFEMLSHAASNETINGVDSDGTNQLDVPANTAFIAWVEAAAGWCVAFTATVVAPDND